MDSSDSGSFPRHERAEFWIQHLDLKPHPEGGYFRETYRASEKIAAEALPHRFSGSRTFATSIYFLLTELNFSAFHRIRQDELWHFHDGDALSVHVLHDSGQYEEIAIGRDVERGERLQAVVPANTWFASSIQREQGYALVGCTVAPGFEFADFEMAERKALAEAFPAHRDLVEKFTR